MEEEPPVTSVTSETTENPETPTPEDNDSTTEESPASPENPETPTSETSQATRNTVIIVVVIVVVIAVVLALFFGLRGCSNDNPNDTPDPDDVNPDPDIVEPGPVEEPEHTHEYGDWQYDDTYHWKECLECGDIIDKEEHTLGEQTLGDDGYYQTCSVCGYATTPVEAVPTSWKVETTGDLTIETTNSESGDSAGTLDLDSFVSITIYDQYGGELSGEGLDSYTITATSGDISVSDHIVTSTQYEAGAASVTLTSTVISGASETLSITLTQKVYSVTQITVDGETSKSTSVKWGESYTATIAITPSYASNTGYEITSDKEQYSELFTVEQGDNGSCTFTHKQAHAGEETFTITPKDGSSASCTLTLTAEKEIVEPGTPYFENLAGTHERTQSLNTLDTYLNYDWGADEDDDHVHDDVTTVFTSSNTSVITIYNETTAGITGTGETTITAKISSDNLENDLTATADINVIWTASTISISTPTSSQLSVGDTVTITATVGPTGQTTNPEVHWSITHGSDCFSLSETTGTSTTITATKATTQGAGIVATADGCGGAAWNFSIISSYGVFATDSWATINEICTNGEASTYYNIGDTKTITINSESHDIRIIGFDHDDLTESDPSYNSNSGKAAITCEMVDCLSTYHAMNTLSQGGSPTNSGGWYSCDMRSYLSDTIFPTLDSNLQSVIKKVDKKSTAGGLSTSLGDTASDSLFLLAEVELNGAATAGYANEGTQYAYWSEHNNNNDRIKKVNSTAHFWWLRSPSLSSGESPYNFCCVSTSGSFSSALSYEGYYVSFAFCI